jgi:pimeloyl-ACP methyl ester carboxylesterase
MPFIERDWGSVHYELEGEGPPLFLLIGGGGDGSAWRRAGYTEQLGRDYRCIAVDPRGFGRSSRPPEPEALRPDEIGTDVVAIADELGLERFTLWGHSAGAAVAQMVAAAEPSRVAALVAAGVTPDLDESELSAARAWSQEAAASVRSSSDLLEVADEIAAAEGIEMPPWLREMFRGSDREMFARLTEMLNEPFWPGCLQFVPPRLLLLGEQEVAPDWLSKARLVLTNTEIAVAADT